MGRHTNWKRNQFPYALPLRFSSMCQLLIRTNFSLIDTNNVCVFVSISDVYKHYLKKLKKKLVYERFDFCTVILNSLTVHLFNKCMLHDFKLKVNEISMELISECLIIWTEILIRDEFCPNNHFFGQDCNLKLKSCPKLATFCDLWH